MADCSSWRVADHDQATGQMAEADHARLTVVLTGVLDLEGEVGKDSRRVLEIEAALIKRLLSLGRIVADAHELLSLQ